MSRLVQVILSDCCCCCCFWWNCHCWDAYTLHFVQLLPLWWAGPCNWYSVVWKFRGRLVVGGTVGGPPLTLWGTGGDLWGPTGGTRAHLLNLQRPTATLTLNSRTPFLRRCTVPTLVLPNLHQTTWVDEVFANIRRKSTKAGLPIQRTILSS